MLMKLNNTNGHTFLLVAFLFMKNVHHFYETKP